MNCYIVWQTLTKGGLTMQWKKKQAGHYYTIQGMYKAVKQKTGVWFLYKANKYLSYSYSLKCLKDKAKFHWQNYSR